MQIKEFSITKKIFLNLSVAWIGVFAFLASFSSNMFGLLYLIGIPFIGYFPGYLTTLLVPIKKLDGVVRALLSVGLSVLWLLVVGLVGNWILPFIGVERPLDTLPVLVEVITLVATLLYIVQRRYTPQFISIPRYVVGRTRFDVVMVLISLVFIALSIVGPLRLNNGAGNGYVMVLLFGMAIFCMYVFRHAEKISKYVLPSI
ncbi:MAG: Conserved transmembrane protein, partial [Parcubacteria group bacterium GW2011_GWC2_42_11]